MIALAVVATAHQSFWTSTLATVLVVGVVALLVGLTVSLILRVRPHGGVRARVGAFIVAGRTAAPAEPDNTPKRSGALAGAQRLLERERWWDELNEKLELARVDRPAIEIVYLTAGCSLAGAALLFALTSSVPLAALPLLAGPLIARSLVNHRLRAQRILFADQLPAHLQELAAAMRAGHSIVSGIAAIVDGASEPTRGEFQRVVADEQLGMPLQDALALVAVRMQATDMEQVSLVAELHRRTGGNMAEVLDRVAEAVRERAELNRELRTLTAQARMSRWIVTALPPFLLVVIYLLNKSYVEVLFNTGTGKFLLALAATMVVVGSIIMSRIVRIEV
jgi:tight adherence protein B